MTPEQIHDLWDTFFKIGLGALIAGVGSFATIFLNSRYEYRKTRRERKIIALEKIDKTISKFIHYNSNFTKKIIEAHSDRKFKENIIINLTNYTDKERKLIAELEIETMSAYNHLLLLGLNNVADELEKLITIQNNFITKIKYKTLLLSIDEINKLPEKIGTSSDKIYQLLNKHYYNVK